MAYSAPHIECVRFAAQRPALGIGCCAIDIFQGFVNDPDAKAVVTLTHGDSGSTLMKERRAAKFGPTNRDVFEGYLRIGTFSLNESPDRIFLAAITAQQIASDIGKKWLAILREHGFEFVRAVNNSVYNGTSGVPSDLSSPPKMASHPVYLFGLFRNISNARIPDPFAPPPEWTALPEPPADAAFQFWHKSSLTLFKEETPPIETAA